MVRDEAKASVSRGCAVAVGVGVLSGVEGEVIVDVWGAVIIIVGVAGVANVVTVAVFLTRVGYQGAVVDGVQNPVAVGVIIEWVGAIDDLVDVRDTVVVVVGVAGIADGVTVVVFLAWVGYQDAVVGGVRNAVAVGVSIEGGNALPLGVHHDPRRCR